MQSLELNLHNFPGNIQRQKAPEIEQESFFLNHSYNSFPSLPANRQAHKEKNNKYNGEKNNRLHIKFLESPDYRFPMKKIRLYKRKNKSQLILKRNTGVKTNSLIQKKRAVYTLSLEHKKRIHL